MHSVVFQQREAPDFLQIMIMILVGQLLTLWVEFGLGEVCGEVEEVMSEFNIVNE